MTTRDHLQLAARARRSERRPVAWLGIVHGYGEHSGRYEEFMDFLAARGIASLALDFRGHGRSPGSRGFVRRWEDFLIDLEAFLEELCRGDEDVPRFVMGHSHGALVLAVAAIERAELLGGVSGVILSSPYFRSAVPVPWWKEAAARVLDVVAPRTLIKSGVKVEWLTSDPELQRATLEDPLGQRVATPRWYRTMQAAQRRASEGAARVTLPLLMLLGEADPVSDVKAIEAFFEAAGSADKTLMRYGGFVHELVREAGRRKVFEDVVGWVVERATSA